MRTETNYGRDHYPRCFTMGMAGGGIRLGFSHGEAFSEIQPAMPIACRIGVEFGA